MTKQEIYAVWAPESSRWSCWAKPVLFAHLDCTSESTMASEPDFDADWAPSPVKNMALVVDLPGPDSVRVGVALAARGYQPIPLFNAVPLPCGTPQTDPLTLRPIAAVNVLPILGALRSGAEQLRMINLPTDAPPAFLLDANRHGGGRTVEPEKFDNRSVCFATDFPSANFLLAHGIEIALLVQHDILEPQRDLAHVLRRWQDGELVLKRVRLDSSDRQPHRFEVARPAWYGAMFQRALAALGLRRAAGGGFGGWMPASSAGG